MGLANSNVHKQDNFFLFLPMYVCLGVYYILEIMAFPFRWIWLKLSYGLYNNVKRDIDTENLRGAYMTEADKIAAEQAAANANKVLTNFPTKKEVKVDKALIEAREALINSIDAQDELRSDIFQRVLKIRVLSQHPR